MPDSARLWVYQSNRHLTDDEMEIITLKGEDFINNWTAHGAQLNAAFEVIYNRFIVIAVDEKQASASGCSIDKSVQLIKALEKQFDLDFFNRLQVVYRNENGLASCNLATFEKLAAEGKVNKDTIVFNNMVTSKKQFDNEWEIALSESWHSRVLN